MITYQSSIGVDMQSEWQAQQGEMEAYYKSLRGLVLKKSHEKSCVDYATMTTVGNRLSMIYYNAVDGARFEDQSTVPAMRVSEKMFYRSVNHLLRKGIAPHDIGTMVTCKRQSSLKSYVSHVREITRKPQGLRETFFARSDEWVDRYVYGEKGHKAIFAWAAMPVALFQYAALQMCPSVIREKRMKAELENLQYRYERHHDKGVFQKIPRL
jgi:hypothetical protein